MRVLVTNPTYRNTTASVRALGREGCHVEVLGFYDGQGRPQDGQAFHSRYCRGQHFTRDSRKDLAGFIDDLEALLQREKFDVLLPISTNTVLPVARHSERIRPLAPFPFPDYDKVETAHDKLKMIRLAEQAGVPVPATSVIENPDQAMSLLQDVRFPVIIKTRKGAASSGVFRADSESEVRSVLNRLEEKPLSDPSRVCVDSTAPMLQEFVPGEIYDVGIIARDGEVLAHTVQCRERTWPVNGGSGMINRTCDNDQVLDCALRVVKALQWTGIGMVEFKLDADGVPRLMELNPKFWGTLDLSIQAGVNFPYLACLLAQDMPLPQVGYRRHLRYRWPLPDGLRTARASRDRWRAAYEFFFPYRLRTTSDLWSSDFGPTWFTLRRLFR